MMSKFVSCVFKIVIKECHTTMFINDMTIYRFMVHSQQIKENKLKEKSMEVKRVKNGDGNFSHSKFDRHGHSKFHQIFSGQGSSNVPSKFEKHWVSNPKPQVVNGSES